MESMSLLSPGAIESVAVENASPFIFAMSSAIDRHAKDLPST